jgi:hypothetical protein
MAHSVSRSTVLAGLIAGAIVALAVPAEAKKKKAEPTEDTAATDADGSSDKKADSPAASQAGDTERPKPIIDSGEAQEGPKADAEGNVAFAGARSGKGKITVQAPAKEKVKVYLEGRYFGLAPRTINKIPSGDYIVEVVFPNGKSLSKPVSVSGDEEATIQVGAADAQPVAPADKPMTADQADKRWGIAKMLGIGAASAVVIGLGLGYWEHTVQNDYNKKVSDGPVSNSNSDKAAYSAQLDSLSNKGSQIALGANVCYIAGAVALVTAVVIGYPAYKSRNAERKPASPDAGTNMSFMFAPSPTLKGGAAGLALTF